MSDDEKPTGTFADYSETNSQATEHPSNYEICQRSGFRFPAGVLVRQWDGLLVHPRYLDQRHPQDFVRARSEAPRPSRSPEPEDVFVGLSDPLATESGDLLELESGGFLLTEAANEVSASDL